SSSLYATRLTLFGILNGPMYHGLSFPRFPNQMIPLQACKRCRICSIFSVVSWIISGPRNLYAAILVIKKVKDSDSYEFLLANKKLSMLMSLGQFLISVQEWKV
ncbi:hypothetical protein Tco_0315152, partial [Tanacetum coccineum]